MKRTSRMLAIPNNAQARKKWICILTTQMQIRTGRMQQQMFVQQEAGSSVTNRCCIWHPDHQPAMSLCISQPAPTTKSVGFASLLSSWMEPWMSIHVCTWLAMLKELSKRRKSNNLISREKLKGWCHLKPVDTASLSPLSLPSIPSTLQATWPKRKLQVPHKTC